MHSGRDEMIGKVTQGLRLSDTALAGCRTTPDKATAAMLVGWEVVVKNCLPIEERWKLENSPPDTALLAEIERIYCTNWPNKRICAALRSFYDADPQGWWEFRDTRALLDLAIRSALEAAFSPAENIPEQGQSGPPD